MCTEIIKLSGVYFAVVSILRRCTTLIYLYILSCLSKVLNISHTLDVGRYCSKEIRDFSKRRKKRKTKQALFQNSVPSCKIVIFGIIYGTEIPHYDRDVGKQHKKEKKYFPFVLYIVFYSLAHFVKLEITRHYQQKVFFARIFFCSVLPAVIKLVFFENNNKKKNLKKIDRCNELFIKRNTFFVTLYRIRKYIIT